MGRRPDLRASVLLPMLFMASTAFAQYVMTADQAIEFIKSTLKLHHDNDIQIANAVKKIKLTQKLDEGRVEELGRLGAGPKTIAALRALSVASETLVAPPPPVAAAAKPVIPPPDAQEQARILHELIDNARSYIKSLPDYMCIQVTRRHFDPTGREDWRNFDRIQEQVSYVNHKEDYLVTMVNGQAVKNVEHQRLGGSTLSGDFGTIFAEIFAPETDTEFTWDHWATLRGKRMYVFAFHVPQSRSQFTIYDGDSHRTVTAAYRGLIYADRDGTQVMRFKFECEDLPSDFPVKAVSLDVNYDFIDIAGHKYVLPLKTEVKSTAQTARGRFMSWNEAEFHLYRKFGTESSIIFDSPDPLPADTTEEKPPVPDAKDQKKPAPPATKKQQ